MHGVAEEGLGEQVVHGVGRRAGLRDPVLGELGLGIVATAVGSEVRDCTARVGSVRLVRVVVQFGNELVGVDVSGETCHGYFCPGFVGRLE